MKWSLRLGSIAGIGIYVHWTFVLLIAWVLWMYWTPEGGLRDALNGLLFVLAVFGCVVLHELGHSLAARRFGIETRDITLLPIGGVATLERMPEEPLQELWVALAGPAVNGVIAVGLIAGEILIGVNPWTEFPKLPGGDFLVNLAAANVLLALFNLLPAFPMDGGRVLRAILAMKTDYVRATQIASNVGQGMAVLFGVFGVMSGQWMLLFVALFVYLGASQEAQAVEARWLFRGVPVRDAMMTRFHLVGEEHRLGDVVRELLAGDQQDFPVASQGRVVGILTRNALLGAIGEKGYDVPVGQVMHRDCGRVDESEMLDRTFDRMREAQCPALPVFRGEQLVGLITLENVGEWMMIQWALRRAMARRGVSNIYRAG